MNWESWTVAAAAAVVLVDIVQAYRSTAWKRARREKKALTGLGFIYDRDYGFYRKYLTGYGWPRMHCLDEVRTPDGRRWIALAHESGDTTWVSPAFPTPAAAFSYAEIANWGRD